MQVARYTLTLGVFLLSANGAVAQNGSHTMTVNEKAASLLARADGIQELNAWPTKARLYEQAAEAMTPNDPELPGALMLAGSIHYYIGQKSVGARLFERAASVAERQGNTARAVDAWYLTMHIAAERKQLSEVRKIIDRLVVLAASENCDEALRVTTLRRIAGPLATLSGISSN
jgi:hypothetical protein